MSSASSELSQASTKAGHDDNNNGSDKHKSLQALKRVAQSAATGQNVLFFLIAFRVLNALTVRTFFQPDEYYQTLEPAWEFAFGQDSGAWITWVSRLSLRRGQCRLLDCRND